MKLAVLGGSFLQRDLIVKALEMGHEVHAIAWREGEVVSHLAHGFHDISLRDKEGVLKKCRELGVEGVVTTSSDVAVPTLARVISELDLFGVTVETASLCTHKGRMRQALKKSNCAIPHFEVHSTLPDSLKFEVPFVIKASDRSGSRGVTVIRSQDDWRKAFVLAQEVSFSGDVVVEEYFEGKQFSVEMISHEGGHHFCGITEEFFGFTGASCEKGDLVPGRLSKEDLECVLEVVSKGLDAVGLHAGPSHTEVRLNERGQCCIIEIGARMGGDFRNRLVKAAYGIDMDECAIKQALGLELSIPVAKSKSRAMISWVFEKEDESVLKRAVEDSLASSHDFFNSPVDKTPRNSAERSGYVIVTSDSSQGDQWIQEELIRNGW